jgi:hypothetical protein
MKYLLSSLTVASFVFSFSVQAGIIIKSVEKSKPADVGSETTMYLDKDNMSIELKNEGKKQVIIFRGDKNVFWVVNNEERTYMEMTQKDLENLKTQMDNTQKMMAEQMKNMPEEQRKMMEQMMPAAAGSAKKEKTEFKKKSGGEKVGKWTCDHYEGFQNGKKSDEVWTASWDQLGIKRSDMSALKKMGEFFEVISQDAGEFMKIGSEEWEKEQGISGVPVRWIDFVDGKGENQGEIKEIIKQDLKAALFELPAGYEKEDNPWQNQGAGMDSY